MLPFLRSDLAQFVAYTPHLGNGSDNSGVSTPPLISPVDRLDTNESPFDLPDELKQKLAWIVHQELESNRYPNGGHRQLKEAIACYVNESADLSPNSLSPNSITPEHISVGNGSDELIRSLLIATCVGGAGSILVAQPTFSMYGILAQTLGIPMVAVGRSEQTFEIELLAAQTAITQVQASPVRVVFVVHPNSPTGNALTAAELAWLRGLPNHILVVIDEAYFEFSQTSVVAELAQHPNWVVLRTFSKAFRLAAYRVGYAIAHPDLTAILEKVRLPYNLPSLSQSAAQLALAHSPLLLKTIPIILAERDRLTQLLAAHPALQVWSSAANFIFLRLRAPTSASDNTLAQIFQQLQTEGTLVRKISGGLRITIGTPDENNRTVERLERVLGRKG